MDTTTPSGSLLAMLADDILLKSPECWPLVHGVRELPLEMRPSVGCYAPHPQGIIIKDGAYYVRSHYGSAPHQVKDYRISDLGHSEPSADIEYILDAYTIDREALGA